MRIRHVQWFCITKNHCTGAGQAERGRSSGVRRAAKTGSNEGGSARAMDEQSANAQFGSCGRTLAGYQHTFSAQKSHRWRGGGTWRCQARVAACWAGLHFTKQEHALLACRLREKCRPTADIDYRTKCDGALQAGGCTPRARGRAGSTQDINEFAYASAHDTGSAHTEHRP